MDLNRWDVTVAQAKEIQNKLRSEIRIETLKKVPQTIAGADISFNRFSPTLFAGFVVLSLPDLIEVDRALVRAEARFPYVPGYLSFREIPALLEAYAALKIKPDVIMADGHGIAHPRRMGIGAHLGLVLKKPTFGCAKSLLYGEAQDVGAARGSVSYLRDAKAGGDIIGALVRTKERAKPVIISPGHLITLEESIALALDLSRGYRIPEPTRRAHTLVNQLRRGEIAI
jgi:deoxyribonuclease V